MDSAYAYMLKEKFGPTNRTRGVDVKRSTNKLERDEKTPRRNCVSTEQVIPSWKDNCSSDQTNFSILNKEVLNEDISIRLLLLPPPPHASACEKSIMDICSRFGSVAVEVIRLPGAANHHFRMYVTSCEESVRVVLPSKFRGAIYINDIRSMPSVDYSVALKRVMNGGFVRVNPMYVAEDEDEVHIDSQKEIDLQMVDEESESVTNRQPVWIPDGRVNRLRHMLSMT